MPAGILLNLSLVAARLTCLAKELGTLAAAEAARSFVVPLRILQGLNFTSFRCLQGAFAFGRAPCFGYFGTCAVLRA